MDDFVASYQTLTTDDAIEFFESGSDIPSMALYSKLSSYCQLGEKPFNTVVDLKGNLVGGVFTGGVESDYRENP